jgi:Tfp pilus assembly protein PilZ
VFVKTDNPIPKGEKFMLKLQLPDIDKTLNIQCQVAWTKKAGDPPQSGANGMGIRFLEMDDKDHQTLRTYVQEVTRKG